MLILTSERCPECDSIVYMVVYPRTDRDRDGVDRVRLHPILGDKLPQSFADGVYLDKDGVLNVTMLDEDSVLPTYSCIFCGWLC